jgi:hypothetical protein
MLGFKRKTGLFLKTSGWKWAIQPLSAVERTVERVPPATIPTSGPMGCDSRPRARAKPLAGRYITHSKFKRAKTADQSPKKEEADAYKCSQEFAASWINDITSMCTAHLAQLASFTDNAWEEAERTGDLHKVIIHYCAAVDGTHDFTNDFFKQFEERAEQLEFFKSELTNYTKIRKLQHKMQLRN